MGTNRHSIHTTSTDPNARAVRPSPHASSRAAGALWRTAAVAPCVPREREALAPRAAGASVAPVQSHSQPTWRRIGRSSEAVPARRGEEARSP